MLLVDTASTHRGWCPDLENTTFPLGFIFKARTDPERERRRVSRVMERPVCIKTDGGSSLKLGNV